MDRLAETRWTEGREGYMGIDNVFVADYSDGMKTDMKGHLYASFFIYMACV